MDIAVVGAAGACGRQTVMQLLERRVAPETHRLQLVGHKEGRSHTELWGLRADLADAFDTWSPRMEVVLEPADIDADLVVMMAGATVSADPGQPTDRVALGMHNAEIFSLYAEELATREQPPMVVVQSNPVELAVEIFAEKLGAHKVIGAAGRSDSLRFAREIAMGLGVPRRDVQAFMLGQHGDHLVPAWSLVRVRGVGNERVEQFVAESRAGRSLTDLPQEIATSRTEMLALIRSGDVAGAFDFVQSKPADLRAAIKPFFTHFTAGRTTEAVTAKSAVDIVAAILAGESHGFSAQVQLDGDLLGLHGVTAVPVIVGPQGVAGVIPVALADDEQGALADAVVAANTANAEVRNALATSGV